MAGLLWPITGYKITQGFAGDNSFEPAGYLINDATGPRRARQRAFPDGIAHQHLHGAIDIGCPIGTPILAPEAGRIVAAGEYESTGEHYMMLEVKPGTVLFFTHLSTFTRAKGHDVARGEEIARSGNTGMSTGPHLHWEVRVSTLADPDPRLSWRWFKWNPHRLRVGGDLAGLAAIRPLNAPVEVVEPITVDPDPVETPPADVSEAESGPSGDSYGDAATVAQMVEAGIPFVGLSGKKPY